MVERFKKKTFIFISQEEKSSKPLGKPAIRLKYLAGVKVRTHGLRAYCQGRYATNPGAYFSIWKDKEVEIYNET